MTDEEITRIKDAADIVEVVSDYVSLRRKGAGYVGLCTFHSDKTPSLHVSPAKGIWKCFACGEGGDAVGFVMKMERVNYIGALKILARKYNISYTDRPMNEEDIRRQREMEQVRHNREVIVEEAEKYIRREDSRGMQYLTDRGFAVETLEAFHIGEMPDADWLVAEHPELKEFPELEALRGRIVIPWYAATGSLVGMAGRVIDKRTKGVNMKFWNSPEDSGFKKGNNVYGIRQAVQYMRQTRTAYLVEGYFDVMAMWQSGIRNVVAQSGTAFTEAQARLLGRYADKVLICLDNDEAGRESAEKTICMLLTHGIKVDILSGGAYNDPAEHLQREGGESLRQWAEGCHKGLFERYMDYFSTAYRDATVEVKKLWIGRFCKHVSCLKDAVERDLWLDKVRSVLPEISAESIGQKLADYGKAKVAVTPAGNNRSNSGDSLSLIDRLNEKVQKQIDMFGGYVMGVDEQGNPLTAWDYVNRELTNDQLPCDFARPIQSECSIAETDMNKQCISLELNIRRIQEYHLKRMIGEEKDIDRVLELKQVQQQLSSVISDLITEHYKVDSGRD